MTTIDTDRTWAVRIEARGLEPVVQGPFTREQANALLGVYLDADRRDTYENGDRPTSRRITCEAFDPADRDISEIIPEGEERFSWRVTIFTVAAAAIFVYFAFHIYHLQLVTPRANDIVIAVGLAFYGIGFLVLIAGDLLNRAWGAVLARWTRSSRRKQTAEVAS